MRLGGTKWKTDDARYYIADSLLISGKGAEGEMGKGPINVAEFFVLIYVTLQTFFLFLDSRPGNYAFLVSDEGVAITVDLHFTLRRLI